MTSSLRVATWNTEWRRPDSPDGKEILRRLKDLSADVICLTETHADMFDGWPGAAVDGGPDPFEFMEPSRRKVLIWSRWNWSKTDTVGGDTMKQGCFIRGEIKTQLGPMTVVGIVIPYHMSNVSHGRKNRKMWEDHERYLDGLVEISHSLPESAIVLGDYNQRLPATFPPKFLRAKLQRALSAMVIATSGMVGPDGKRSNDHISCGLRWTCENREAISNVRLDGGQLSDHFGVWVDLQQAPKVTWA